MSNAKWEFKSTRCSGCGGPLKKGSEFAWIEGMVSPRGGRLPAHPTCAAAFGVSKPDPDPGLDGVIRASLAKGATLDRIEFVAKLAMRCGNDLEMQPYYRALDLIAYMTDAELLLVALRASRTVYSESVSMLEGVAISRRPA